MIFTTNGVYSLKQINDNVSDKTAVFVSGTLGGGTVTVGYKDDFGDFIPFTSGELASGEQGVFFHGVNLKPYINVSDTVGASISVHAAGVK